MYNIYSWLFSVLHNVPIRLYINAVYTKYRKVYPIGSTPLWHSSIAFTAIQIDFCRSGKPTIKCIRCAPRYKPAISLCSDVLMHICTYSMCNSCFSNILRQVGIVIVFLLHHSSPFGRLAFHMQNMCISHAFYSMICIFFSIYAILPIQSRRQLFYCFGRIVYHTLVYGTPTGCKYNVMCNGFFFHRRP